MLLVLISFVVFFDMKGVGLVLSILVIVFLVIVLWLLFLGRLCGMMLSSSIGMLVLVICVVMFVFMMLVLMM